ncbi:MAG TPA: beta-glucosidase [Polyangia bacterium]|jgi:hypothetical protein|nr:beta-glucosidase [Polyangia bacterium]
MGSVEGTGRGSGGPTAGAPLVEGFFWAGFECSCQQLEDGRRLDLTVSTRHDAVADGDFARARALGFTACRDGVSWVRTEPAPGRHDFRSVLPLLRAAERHGVQVVWDLMHFGWPADVDVFAPSFPARFARHARAFAEWLRDETARPVMLTPINEMSFLAWAGGDVRCMNPFEAARGVELKVQLVRATIEAIDAVRAVVAGARFLQPEPVINIVRSEEHPLTWRRVESDNLLQYQAWDMLTGAVWPALGGHPRYLDIIGVNFYPDNQFMLDGTTIRRGDPRYRPFSRMLLEVWARYGRPMLVSETGSEGDERAPWLRYVCDECELALAAGCELHGITLYPAVNHPGWLDDRRCENGLWDYADAESGRALYAPLAEEVARQTPRMLAAREALLARRRAHPAAMTA